MNFRWSIVSVLVILLLTGIAYAQTADYHLSVGISLDSSPPLEEIDMSRAKGGQYGPAEGSQIQVFILDGMFGRKGPGASARLQKSERIGSPHILMFEDGRWQPLRPVGLHHGYELDFARRMAEVMPGETVGVIMQSDDGGVVPKALEAQRESPCQFLAYVRLNDEADEVPAMSQQIKDSLRLPDLIVVDSSSTFNFKYKYLGRLEAIDDQARTLFRKVYERMNSNPKDK